MSFKGSGRVIINVQQRRPKLNKIYHFYRTRGRRRSRRKNSILFNLYVPFNGGKFRIINVPCNRPAIHSNGPPLSSGDGHFITAAANI